MKTEEFLYLMVAVIKDLNSGKTSVTYTPKSLPDHNKDLAGTWVLSLKLTKAQYVDAATRVYNYCINNGVVPNYANLINGEQANYRLYTYEFARILCYYNQNGKLPNSFTFDSKIFESYSISVNLSSRVGTKLHFYLTTDNIIGPSTDSNALNKIRDALVALGYEVTIVGVGPNWHNIAWQYGCTGPNSVLLCCFGGVDVGCIEEWTGELGTSFPYHYQGANIFSVFYLDPYGCSPTLHDRIERAWDADYGWTLDDPAQYMEGYGISYIQTGTVDALINILKLVFNKSSPVPPPVPSNYSVTVSEVIEAGVSLRKYVLNNYVLPSSCNVGNFTVNSAQLSYLMGVAINYLDTGMSLSTKIDIINVSVPSYSSSINYTAKKVEYVDLANRVSNYCTINGAAPNYASIGSSKVDFKTYAYCFAFILAYYKYHDCLPASCVIDSGVYVKPTPVPTNSVTVSEVIEAGVSLRKYVLNNYVLPSSCNVGNFTVNSAQLSYLMGVAINYLDTGMSLSTKIDIINVSVPSYSSSINYTAKKAEYVTLANNVSNYSKSNEAAPGYVAIGSSKVDFKTYAYCFAFILAYYKYHDCLPAKCVIDSGVYVKPTPVPTNSVTVSEVIEAGVSLRKYVLNNYVLPSSCNVGNFTVNSAQLSYLMGVAISYLDAGKDVSTRIDIINVSVPKYSSTVKYTAKKSEYVDLANRVSNYCKNNGAAPNYASLGSSKVDFKTYAYCFAFILAYYKYHDCLPASCVIDSSTYK